MAKSNSIMRLIAIPILLFFVFFLLVPLSYVMIQSFQEEGRFTFTVYEKVLQDEGIRSAFFNSLNVSLWAASITTIIAFILAYAVHFTKMSRTMRKLVQTGIMLPMLLPTITYGFVLIYTFGNQGTITQIFGKPLFSIYGFNGLLIGYVLYTVPIAYVLMSNVMQYIDKQFIYISYLMNDRPMRRFYHTIFRPMVGTIGGAFILAFILSFTDFGIPASVGGEYDVVAMSLYRAMLGSIVRFEEGAAIAMLMLIPACVGFIVLSYLQKFTIRFKDAKSLPVLPYKVRDISFTMLSVAVVVMIFVVFSTLIIVPFTKGYPYDLSFTLDHLMSVLKQKDLVSVYINSVIVASLTAVLGVVISFSAALMSTRTAFKGRAAFDYFSMITNTVPGMVLGLAYLFFFNGSSLKGTLLIIILSNIVHFFTTPYMMAKNALQKMDIHWEITGRLLQDSWLQTVFRVILPNSMRTIYSMLSYYFLNAMVTVSGVIFIVSTSTMLVSTRIKELQHFAKYTDIFILSLFILITNLVVKMIFDQLSTEEEKQS